MRTRKEVRTNKDPRKVKAPPKNLRQAALDSVDKTIKSVYYFSRFSNVLLKLYNARKTPDDFFVTGKKKNADVSFTAERFLTKWVDNLMWLHTMLEQLNKMTGRSDISPAQLKEIISTTRKLRAAIKNGEGAVTFVILSRWFLFTVFRPFSGIGGLIAMAILNFFFSKLDSIIPSFDDFAKSMSTFLGETPSNLKGPLSSYWSEAKSEMKETNPELYATLKNQAEQMSPIMEVANNLAQKGKSVLEFSKDHGKRLQSVLLPVIEDGLELSYKAFRSSYQKLLGEDPLKVLSSLREDGWTRELTKPLKLFAPQQSRKTSSTEDDEQTTPIKNRSKL
eukprot:TRINITY_DN7481_c0_g1_i2.p1 TRINITY_DN7481_c0_g1~~TRINITY_DN7481_c0_g1_i2.p1  ORF type:complete len:335 (+),score=62.38 TRINITY_DN7481_c0_g1_i2:231-1235(+)